MFKYLILLVLFLIQSCAKEPEEIPAPEGDITYTNTVKNIIDIRCIGCHNNSAPTRNWLTYEAVYKKRDLIRFKLFNGSMPPGNSTRMTPQERQAMIKWVYEGAKK